MRDYTLRAAFGAITVIVVLIAVGAIPEQSFGGVDLRRIDIFSQLRSDEQQIKTPSEPEELKLDIADFEVDMANVVLEATKARESMAQREEVVKIERVEPRPKEVVPSPDGEIGVDIYECDSLDRDPFERFYKRLLSPNSTTRIAVLGDSFIEGDILTADLRESMQSLYGGIGAGFVPFDSPHTKYRSTIRSESDGWNTCNIMKSKELPADLSPYWYVSGWLSQPSVGARAHWEMTKVRRGASRASVARLLFVSRDSCELSVAINGADTQRHSFCGSVGVQQLICECDSLGSLDLTVESGAAGFVGYGAIFEGASGVVVDNYAIRSNNGQAVLWSDPATNVQIDALTGGYDLVILQYGLNILQRGVVDYSRYGAQVEKIVAYVKECFPSAAIVVMGVSQRSMRLDGRYLPLEEARDLSSYQRAAAVSARVAFWDTYEAMEQMGGMSQFVANKWASKDYTHINFAGGRELGRALAAAVERSRARWFPPEIDVPRLDPMVVGDDLWSVPRVERCESVEQKIMRR